MKYKQMIDYSEKIENEGQRGHVKKPELKNELQVFHVIGNEVFHRNKNRR
jgi:hypothetical protein